MRRTSAVFFLCSFLIAVPAFAQHWSFGAGVGPFVFGDFARETFTPIGGGVGEPTEVKLTAKAGPGFTADFERDFNGRFALRIQGAFTDSKLQVKSSSAGGVSLDAGTLDVTTFTLPLVIRFNPNGTFRFHIFGGPAYAMYKIQRENTPAGVPDTFSGTRSNWGGSFGGGVEWWLSDRWAATGEIADIVTASPFDASDFNGSKVETPKPQNIHTTVGIRIRF
jgi:opacity protein-like surface antigen